jgi:hypothetical protein
MQSSWAGLHHALAVLDSLEACSQGRAAAVWKGHASMTKKAHGIDHLYARRHGESHMGRPKA